LKCIDSDSVGNCPVFKSYIWPKNHLRTNLFVPVPENEQIDPELLEDSAIPQRSLSTIQGLGTEDDNGNNPEEYTFTIEAYDEQPSKSSPAIERQFQSLIGQKRKKRSSGKAQEAQNLMGFAERISNKFSCWIAETRAKKLVRQTSSDDSNAGSSSVSIIKSPDDRFKEYREALAILMQL